MSNYSSLIRRSKLAAYTTGIDQVYSAHGAHLARSNFGLKRPLPKASTSTAPYVRVSRLDNTQKRTEYRKATREALFVKKFTEAGVRLRAIDASATGDIEQGPIQSRFIAPGQAGSIGSAAALELARPPNFLAMPDDEFAAFLDSLDGRRAEFADFVELAHANSKTKSAGPVDLAEYAAGARPTELNGHVETFLARTNSPDPDALPAPQPHRTLALQYSHPTRLEAAFAPPVPGRLLGTDVQASQKGRAPRNLSSVLGLISHVDTSSTAGASSTTWFPDSAGVRSNAPGRAAFALNAEMNASFLPVRMSLAARRGQKEFQPPKTPYEPEALAASAIRLTPTVVDGVLRPAPGTPAYSGQLPPGRRVGGFEDMYQFQTTPRDLLRRPSPKDRFTKSAERGAVFESRKKDAQLFGKKGKGRSTSAALSELLTSLSSGEDQ